MFSRLFRYPSALLPAISALILALLPGLLGCGASTAASAGTPVVNRQTPVVSWTTPAAVSYGTALSATQLQATASVAGTFVYTPAAGTVLTAGSQTLSVAFTPTDAVNYTTATQTTTLTVARLTPVVTLNAPASLTSGSTIPAAQYFASASVLGTFAYSPAQGAVLTATGSQTLTATFTPTDSVDYNPVVKTASLTLGTPSYGWKSVRIVAGGFITGIVAHPTQANLRYVRTDIGGAYRWDATTSTWIPLLDFLSSAQDNLLGVESIALDPTNPQKLYMACGTYAAESFAGNGAMLLSNDQGATFTIVNVPIKIGSNDSGRHAGERLAVDPNLPSTLYFGSRLVGLWRSTNSGTSWSQVTSFPVTALTSGVGVTFVDFVKSSGASGTATPIVYVGVSDGGAAPNSYATVYYSADAGVTWNPVPNAPASLTGQYVSHGVLGPDNLGTNGALYLSYGNAPGPTGVTTGALWKYTLPPNSTPSAAGIWTNIAVGTPARPTGSQGGYGAIALDPQRPGVLMSSTMDDYYPGDDIYRSTNYGASWVSLNAQGKTHDYSLSPWLSFHNPGVVKGTGNWPGTLLIDPLNSSRFLYGNGQTLWDSANIQVSDTGGVPAFTVGALGIEEASISAIVSPAAGPSLFSGMGDIDGMVHTDLNASPATGMIGPNYSNTIGKTLSIDYAQNVPLTVVIDGVGGGAIATDGGVTNNSWTPLTLPTGSTTAQGTIAIAADASTIVWDTSDGVVAWSIDKGKTWTNATGAIVKSKVFADRINPLKFYISSGTTLQISTDGGRTFTSVSTTLPSGNLAVSPAAEGDLWLAAGASLRHSTDSGNTFVSVTGLSNTNMVAFGKAANLQPYPAIYAIATGASGQGFYRSIDAGVTWVYINDALHQFAYTPMIAADPKVFGRIYIGTNGRGIFYGDSSF